uniref:Uncharacterized protein n=1 Tax=Anguilla anguilla TaxID=7936 RepID=A0A0E9US06_ANGAN
MSTHLSFPNLFLHT